MEELWQVIRQSVPFETDLPLLRQSRNENR